MLNHPRLHHPPTAAAIVEAITHLRHWHCGRIYACLTDAPPPDVLRSRRLQTPGARVFSTTAKAFDAAFCVSAHCDLALNTIFPNTNQNTLGLAS